MTGQLQADVRSARTCSWGNVQRANCHRHSHYYCSTTHPIQLQLGIIEKPCMCAAADASVIDCLAGMVDSRVPGARQQLGWAAAAGAQTLLWQEGDARE